MAYLRCERSVEYKLFRSGEGVSFLSTAAITVPCQLANEDFCGTVIKDLKEV